MTEGSDRRCTQVNEHSNIAMGVHGLVDGLCLLIFFVCLLHIVHEKSGMCMTSDHLSIFAQLECRALKIQRQDWGFSSNQYADQSCKVNRPKSKEQKVGFLSYPSRPELAFQLPKSAEFVKQNLHFTPKLQQNFRCSLLNVSETNISFFTPCYTMSTSPLTSAPNLWNKQKNAKC